MAGLSVCKSLMEGQVKQKHKEILVRVIGHSNGDLLSAIKGMKAGDGDEKDKTDMPHIGQQERVE